MATVVLEGMMAEAMVAMAVAAISVEKFGKRKCYISSDPQQLPRVAITWKQLREFGKPLEAVLVSQLTEDLAREGRARGEKAWETGSGEGKGHNNHGASANGFGPCCREAQGKCRAACKMRRDSGGPSLASARHRKPSWSD